MRRGGIAASPEETVMSFNPLFTLLARGLVDLVEPSPDVIELGNQTLNADQRALRTVLARSKGLLCSYAT